MSKKILKSFKYFSEKILEGNFGAFFSVKDLEVGEKYFFGFGDFEAVSFEGLNKKGEFCFPFFSVTDWKGDFQKNIYFKENFSSSDLSFLEKESVFGSKKNKKSLNEVFFKKSLKIGFSENQKKNLGLQKENFFEKVKKVQDFQKNGDCWVLNLAENFEYEISEIFFEKNITPLKENLKLSLLNKRENNVNYLLKIFYEFLKLKNNHCGGVFINNEQSFCSLSPEIFILEEKNKIISFPIKGTGSREYLEKSEKEISELDMITDLMRNDLGKICAKVEVDKSRYLLGENNYFHARTKIVGVLQKKIFTQENYKNLLPAGSISGAPKKRVLEIISELEDFDREYFTGTFGVRISEKESIFNILIRTFFADLEKNIFHYPVGVGITIESDFEKEWKELLLKQEVLKKLQGSVKIVKKI